MVYILFPKFLIWQGARWTGCPIRRGVALVLQVESQRALLSRNKKRKQYSKGEIDRIIDFVVHSLYKRNSAFMIVDATRAGKAFEV